MALRVAGWTLLSFFSGSIPFSLLVGQLALGTDIRDVGDGNPGATNVLRSGSKVWAFVAAFLDMLKAALPIAVAYTVWTWRGFGVVPIALAPLFGHIYSPFLKGRGGKGIAVTGGIWIGLTYGIGTVIGAVCLTIGYLIQRNPGWAVICAMVGVLGYLLVGSPDPVLLTVWAANTVIVLWRHRSDLRHPPVVRNWLRRNVHTE
jgi:glycerol-3-phosphate acyltransferase PlsY